MHWGGKPAAGVELPDHPHADAQQGGDCSGVQEQGVSWHDVEIQRATVSGGFLERLEGSHGGSQRLHQELDAWI